MKWRKSNLAIDPPSHELTSQVFDYFWLNSREFAISVGSYVYRPKPTFDISLGAYVYGSKLTTRRIPEAMVDITGWPNEVEELRQAMQEKFNGFE